MTKRSIAACALIVLAARSGQAQAPVAAPAIHDFRINSIGSTYPFAVEVHGTYWVYPDSVVVKVVGGEVASQVPRALGQRGRATEVTLSAILGGGTIASWNGVGDTPAAKVGAVLEAGARIPVPPLRFTIVRPDTVQYRDHWLAFQLGVQQHLPVEGFREGDLFSYACAEDYLLGPTPESRARAAAQRKNYSTVC